MTPPRRPARAEVVGSLLRPPALRQAVESFYEEGHSAVLPEERAKDRRELTHIEDEAIREAVQPKRSRRNTLGTEGGIVEPSECGRCSTV